MTACSRRRSPAPPRTTPRAGARPRRAGSDCRAADRDASSSAQLAGHRPRGTRRARPTKARAAGSHCRTRDRIAPLPVDAGRGHRRRTRDAGRRRLRRGEVAALLVAGGQGSRLGFDKPKGMYPGRPGVRRDAVPDPRREGAGPVAAVRQAGPVPGDDQPGDPRRHASVLRREPLLRPRPATVIVLPAGDDAGGRASRPAGCCSKSPGRLFLSPNGHGGTLTALAERGVLDRAQGTAACKHVFYFQVDNPLVKIGDPGFLGRHIATRVGGVVEGRGQGARRRRRSASSRSIDGRCGMIEYSDLPPETGRGARAGRARCASAPATRRSTCSRVDFLERVTATGGLPYHVARKAVPHFDPRPGEIVDAGTEERAEVRAVHLRRAAARRTLARGGDAAGRGVRPAEERDRGRLARDRAGSADSRSTRAWLEARRSRRRTAIPVEIRPLFALDADELKSKDCPPGSTVTGPTHLR